MPMITIRYATPQEGENIRPRVAELAARLAHEKLGEDLGVTAVLAEAADPQGWFIAGKKPVDAGLAAFWLDIKVTAGTNTKDETAGFVKAVFDDGMGALPNVITNRVRSTRKATCWSMPRTAMPMATAGARRTPAGPSRIRVEDPMHVHPCDSFRRAVTDRRPAPNNRSCALPPFRYR